MGPNLMTGVLIRKRKFGHIDTHIEKTIRRHSGEHHMMMEAKIGVMCL